VDECAPQDSVAQPSVEHARPITTNFTKTTMTHETPSLLVGSDTEICEIVGWPDDDEGLPGENDDTDWPADDVVVMDSDDWPSPASTVMLPVSEG